MQEYSGSSFMLLTKSKVILLWFFAGKKKNIYSILFLLLTNIPKFVQKVLKWGRMTHDDNTQTMSDVL